MKSRSVGTLAAELGVIVVGILIALAVDTWWQQRQDRSAETGILAAVHAEFLVNEARYLEAIRTHERILESATTVLTATAADCGDDLAEALEWALYHWYSYDPFSGETELLIATGRLDLIRDPDLRRLLASWRAIVADLVEDEVRALARRDAIVDFIAMNAPTRGPEIEAIECRMLLSDPRFRYLLLARQGAERDFLTEENRGVGRAIAAILDATS